MTSLLSIDRNATPAEFFDRYVASELAQVELPPDVAAEQCEIRIEGAGGGTWTLGVEGARPVLRAGTADDPLVRIAMSVDSWRALLLGTVRDRLLDALGGTGAIERAHTPRMVRRLLLRRDTADALRQLDGNLLVVIDDPDEMDEYRIAVGFAGKPADLEQASTRIEVGAADWVAMFAGQLLPQAAFMQGRIRIDGDMNLPMGLMSALMS